jgi:hypothetical protein
LRPEEIRKAGGVSLTECETESEKDGERKLHADGELIETG